MRCFVLLPVHLLLLVVISFAQGAPSRVDGNTRRAEDRLVQAGPTGSIDILFQNDLTSGEPGHGAVLLHQPSTASEAAAACQNIGEELLSSEAVSGDILDQLNYLALVGKTTKHEGFWLRDGSGAAKVGAYDGKRLQFARRGRDSSHSVLCTHTAPATSYGNEELLPKASFYGEDKRIAVNAGAFTFTGLRDQRSFRFLGIPFADPPTGPKRFKHASPYTGSRNIDATQYGNACIQLPSPSFVPTGLNTSEDCLNLNVYTTSLPSQDKGTQQRLKPVFVWIYGGSFTSGRNSQPMLDGGNMASRGDVVVVNLNYRLGALGLLASGDDLPGNAAISDQIMALKWVKRHISAFGGDPNQVTIGGESAGGQSVSALLASPHSTGLYRAAVMQSAPDVPWHTKSLATEVVTPFIAGKVGCAPKGPEMARCLRAVDAQHLANVLTDPKAATALATSVAGYYAGTAATGLSEPFLPVIDNLLQDQYFYLLGNGTLPNRVPLMIGTLSGEGTAFVEKSQAKPLPAFDVVYRKALSVLAPSRTVDRVLSSGLFDLQRNNRDTVRERVDEFMTLASWACPTYHQAQAGSRTQSLVKTYVYEFDTGIPFSTVGLPPKCKAEATGLGACHGNDQLVTFGNMNVAKVTVSREFLDYVRQVNDYWTSFIRTTDPNPSMAYLKARGRSYESTLSAVARAPWHPLNVAAKAEKVQLLHKSGFRSGPFPHADQCRFLDQTDSLLYETVDYSFATASSNVSSS